MKTKLEMAHDYAMQHLKNCDGKITMHSLCLFAWQYADAMQTEADKRENKETCDKSLNIDSKELNVEEWQPDWSQAPDNADSWTMRPDGKCLWWKGIPVFNFDRYSDDVIGVCHTVGYAPSFDYTGDWRDSLRKRPE